MILIMKQEVTESQLLPIINKIKENGLNVQVNHGKDRIVLGLLGDPEILQTISFQRYPIVERVVPITNSYKLTSREFHPQNTVVDVDGVKIGDGSFVTMAGPCSVEGEEQIMEAARMAKAGGAKILRGGAYKPRTSPYAFQGLGEEGLKLMRKAADAYDLKVE